jgi:nitroreductase
MDESRSAHLTFALSGGEAAYKTIFARREGRRFLSAPIPAAAIERILLAARPASSAKEIDFHPFVLSPIDEVPRQFSLSSP